VFSLLLGCKQISIIFSGLHLFIVQGHVGFEDVSFGYNPDKIVIHDFTAAVKPGQKIAIVGPTGAGKTTLVNLIMRFYEVQQGQIVLDGVDTKNYSRAALRGL
jgi:ATP-binding cassette subfamily B protein